MSLQLRPPNRSVQPRSVQVTAPQTVVTSNATGGTRNITTQQQSLQLAMIFLHCSISELCYERRIFTPDCFEDRPVPDDGNPLTYKDYVTASHTDNEILVPSSDAISRPRVLKRGVRSGANTLLKWMEESAFPILERQFLHSIVIRILENPLESENILEEHVINIEYPLLSTGQEIRSIQRSIPNAVSRLVEYGRRLPNLPPKKHITMLLQHATLPRNELPVHFQSDTLMDISFPNLPGFTTDLVENAMINTGYLNFSLQTTFLRSHDFGSRMTPADIPPGATYKSLKRRASRNEDGTNRNGLQYHYDFSQGRKHKSLEMDISASMKPLRQGSVSTVMVGSSPTVMRAQPPSSAYMPSPEPSSESNSLGPVLDLRKVPQTSFDGHQSQRVNHAVSGLDNLQTQQTRAFRRPPQARPTRPSQTFPAFRAPPLQGPLVLGVIRATPREERGTLEEAKRRLNSLPTIMGFVQADDPQAERSCPKV